MDPNVPTNLVDLDAPEENEPPQQSPNLTFTDNDDFYYSASGKEEQRETILVMEEEGAVGKWYELSYWQTFFRITSGEVGHRLLWGSVPGVGRLLPRLQTQPDLWAPLWLPATLTFALAAGGHAASLGQEQVVVPTGQLGVAAAIWTSYLLAVPLGMWALLRWAGAAERWVVLLDVVTYPLAPLLAVLTLAPLLTLLGAPTGILWVISLGTAGISAGALGGNVRILVQSLPFSKALGFGALAVGVHWALCFFSLLYFFLWS